MTSLTSRVLTTSFMTGCEQPGALQYGPHYDALVDNISRHVCHADEFPPDLTWSDHKNAGRVHRLYMDMDVSYFNI